MFDQLHRCLVRIVLTGVLIGAVPEAVLAQDRPIVQVGADGRFEKQLDDKVRVDGFSASQVAVLRDRVDQMVAMFEGIRQVHTPTAPVCRRIRSYLEVTAPRGMLSAEVGVTTPVQFQAGRCSELTGGGVALWLNRFDGVFLNRNEAHVVGAEGRDVDWYAPRFVERTATRIELEDGTVAFTRAGRALLLPVSLERYMREQARIMGEASTGGAAGGHLARFRAEELPGMRQRSAEALEAMQAFSSPAEIEEMRRTFDQIIRETEEAHARRDAEEGVAQIEGRTWTARLAALTPAQRQAQTCVSVTTGQDVDLDVACARGVLLWELNPDYFDASRPETLQLLVLENHRGPYFGETPLQYATRQEIVRDMDLRPFLPR